MNSNRSYTRYTWFVLIMIFLVILAGGVVRTTQSGMGCPDWPTCFGRWIPPTSVKDLPADYEKYLRKQDIDHTFNALHTWIESVNRYLGALLGIFCIIHLVWSFRRFFRTRPTIFWWSLFMLLATAFQGWLGKRVVDANLAVVKITTHMLVALVIAAVPVIILTLLKGQRAIASPVLKKGAIAVLLLVIVQIVLGTDVREQIDEVSKPLGYEHRELWLNNLDIMFLVHRSLSWLVVLSIGWLWWKSRSYTLLAGHRALMLAVTVVVLAAGLVMYFFHMPAAMQPVHLLSASILSITLFSFRLQLK